MQHHRPIIAALALLVLLSPFAGFVAQALPRHATAPLDVPDVASQPLLFVENKGQFAAGARFRVWGGGEVAWVDEQGLWLTVIDPVSEGETVRGAHVRVTLDGANPAARIVPFDESPVRVAYLLGDDPAAWQRNVRAWRGVRFENVYPGIDWELSSDGGTFCQRLVVEPGADVGLARLRVEGADALAVDDRMLVMDTTGRHVSLPLLSVVAAHGSPSIGSPVIEGNLVGCPLVSSDDVGARSAASVPTGLLYSTYFGGSEEDAATAVAVGPQGNLYVAGFGNSTDFPATPGAFDVTMDGGSTGLLFIGDAWLAQFNPTGTALLSATFIGGATGGDVIASMVVDGQGNAWLAGQTSSTDFPTTAGSIQRFYGGGTTDGFVATISADASTLLSSTFVGGTGSDAVRDVVLAPGGDVYMLGGTNSRDLPTTPGVLQPRFRGEGLGDLFVGRLDSTLSARRFLSYFGGSDNEEPAGLALDDAGNVYLCGWTASTDLPVSGDALYPTPLGGVADIFLSRLDAMGTELQLSTYLGGRREDKAIAMVRDDLGNIYISGQTQSDDFVTTPNAYSRTWKGASDCFVLRLNASATEIGYGTLIGGAKGEEVRGMTVDGSGNVAIVGRTASSDFPTSPGAFDRTFNGLGTLPEILQGDGFVSRFSTVLSGDNAFYSSLLGGGESDMALGVTGAGDGALWIVGRTPSTNFPVTTDALDPVFSGGGRWADAFITRLGLGEPPTYTPTPTCTATATLTPSPTATLLPGQGAIRACVWRDLDGDGSWDPSEQALSGVTISMIGPAQQLIGSCVTQGVSCCTVGQLGEGTYTVRAEALPGWESTTPNSRAVDVVSGHVSEVAFGLRPEHAVYLPIVIKAGN